MSAAPRCWASSAPAGIGQDLIEAVRKFYYNDVAALLVLIILTVVVIDTLTGQLRHRLLGGPGGMSGTHRLRAAALDRLPALRLAYPAQFRAVTPGRLQAAGLFLCWHAAAGLRHLAAADRAVPAALRLRPAAAFPHPDAAARSRLHGAAPGHPAGAGGDPGDRLPRHAAGRHASPCRSACWRRATPPSTAWSASPPAGCWTASVASMR